MPLTDEEQAQLDALTKKKDEPDTPAATHSRVENINLTIDLSDEAQVKAAVRAGYLPASYLEDDADPDPAADDGTEGDPPKRRARFD